MSLYPIKSIGRKLYSSLGIKIVHCLQKGNHSFLDNIRIDIRAYMELTGHPEYERPVRNYYFFPCFLVALGHPCPKMRISLCGGPGVLRGYLVHTMPPGNLNGL
jgi:hypothetical protein